MDILMKSNIYDSIPNFIRQHIALFDSFDNIYLFGSILNISKAPNDIDILLIYSKHSNSIIKDLNNISSVLEKMFNLPIDLTVLSIEEERETKFLKRIDSLYLKLK